MIIEGEPCRVLCDETTYGFRVVEGVGFDHDELGDLLAPYQIMFGKVDYTVRGLHHVENAEGTVIYKGSAYYADGRLPGDINGSGVVDIDDLNVCIARLLTLHSVDVTADLTGDGLVDIDDVNRLVDIMLKKQDRQLTNKLLTK